MILFIILLSLRLFSLGPYVAGQFYPQSKDEIERFISQSIKEAKEYSERFKKERIIGVITPHAGYQYSGKIQAISYSIIPDDTEIFIILSPSHRNFINAAALTKERFDTPYGSIETDKAFINLLLKNKMFEENSAFFEKEHSIEVQLPFIIHKSRKAKIVPILLNTYDLSKLEEIATEIANAIKKTNKKSVLIISSDFSHYPDYETAGISDLTMVEAIKTMDEKYIDLTQKVLLSKNIENLQTTACGISAIITGVKVAKLLGADNFILIKHSTSYDAWKSAGSKNVVGYVSGAFINKNSKKENRQFQLTQEDKKKLLSIAKESIYEYLHNKKEIITPTLDKNPEFNLPAAVFITLYKNKYLRGCIGTTHPQTTLIDAVKYFAIQAAVNDPRFSPVKEEELKDIKIEISILSKLQEIKSYKEIKEKEDGVVVVNKNGSGLFLPQVWEFFKNREEFLSELCVEKAGLSKDCWKDDNTRLYKFKVDIISE